MSTRSVARSLTPRTACSSSAATPASRCARWRASSGRAPGRRTATSRRSRNSSGRCWKRRSARSTRRCATAADRAGDDPAARFEAVCRAYVAYGLTYPKHYEVAFLLDAGGLPAMPIERLRGGRMALDFLADLVEAGTRAGALHVDVARERPVVTAGVIWAALHGAVSIAIGNRILPGQGLTVDEVVDATLRGLVARYVVPRTDRAP